MTQILSHTHVDLILSGIRIEGYAEEDEPVEFPDGSDRVEIKTGADGASYGVSKAMFGGDVTIRLEPTSPSTQQFIQWGQEQKENMRNRRAFRIHSGSYTDTVQRRSSRLEGGMLKTWPDQATPDKTFEVVIHFDDIINQVDAAVFHPPLTSDA